MQKHIATYVADDILQALQLSRERVGLSQRDLSVKSGVPQSHISKIENGGTDLRLSSLIELARALDQEVVLVPRKLLPAVQAIVRNASSASFYDARLQSAMLNRARAALAKLERRHPGARELARADQALQELTKHKLGNSDLETIRRLTDRFKRIPNNPAALSSINNLSEQLEDMRNRVAHAQPEAPRPAYALDEEDEDA